MARLRNGVSKKCCGELVSVLRRPVPDYIEYARNGWYLRSHWPTWHRSSIVHPCRADTALFRMGRLQKAACREDAAPLHIHGRCFWLLSCCLIEHLVISLEGRSSSLVWGSRCVLKTFSTGCAVKRVFQHKKMTIFHLQGPWNGSRAPWKTLLNENLSKSVLNFWPLGLDIYDPLQTVYLYTASVNATRPPSAKSLVSVVPTSLFSKMVGDMDKPIAKFGRQSIIWPEQIWVTVMQQMLRKLPMAGSIISISCLETRSLPTPVSWIHSIADVFMLLTAMAHV